jgi:hypothetical protein
MFKRKCLSNAVAAAFFATSAQLAFAVDEAEPNDSLGATQQLSVGTDGKIIVQGTIGVTGTTETPIPDVDFYSFEGRAGDPITVDIDDGIKAVGATTRHVDTIVALFRPAAVAGTWEILLQNDNTPSIDEGSAPIGGERDARLDNPPVALPVDGTYIVGVSSAPRLFRNDGSTTSTTVTGDRARFPNGSYTLIISGVTPPQLVQYVNIDIKPGDPDEVTRLNPKSKRVIPIALLSNAAAGSSPAFNALEVKVDSITFGRGGEEKSLVRCHKDRWDKHHHGWDKHHNGRDKDHDGIPNKRGWDVNRDGLPDLVCLFDISAGAFTEDDLVGKMKGESANGMRFEAVAKLKVKAPRKYRKHDHRDDDD